MKIPHECRKDVTSENFDEQTNLAPTKDIYEWVGYLWRMLGGGGWFSNKFFQNIIHHNEGKTSAQRIFSSYEIFGGDVLYD